MRGSKKQGFIEHKWGAAVSTTAPRSIICNFLTGHCCLYLIISLLFSSTAFGDSTPFEDFKKWQDESKKQAAKNPTSYVKMPYAGIDVVLNESKELEVAGVTKGLPAGLAGIQTGDIVTKIDGIVITSRYQAAKIYDSKSSGDSIEVEIKRNGKLLRKQVNLESIDMPYDFYIMGDLISKEIPVRLAVVAGEMNFSHAIHQEDVNQYKEAIIAKVINLLESVFIRRYRNENNVVVVDRQMTKAILNELKFQESGLVSTESRKKMGALLGASHLLILNYSWIVDKSGRGYEQLIRKLIEIESGKVLATVNVEGAADEYNQSTVSVVKQDLLDYYNNRLSKIFPLESEAIKAFRSVTGKNFKSDQLLYDSLINVVIPKYDTFVKQLTNISPKTTEVKNLHNIYVEGANYQLQSFTDFKIAIEKGDMLIVKKANESLTKGEERVEEWQTSLKELFKKENIEIKK